MKKNKHTGISFDDFLKEDGLYEEVTIKAKKKQKAKKKSTQKIKKSVEGIKLSKGDVISNKDILKMEEWCRKNADKLHHITLASGADKKKKREEAKKLKRSKRA